MYNVILSNKTALNQILPSVVDLDCIKLKGSANTEFRLSTKSEYQFHTGSIYCRAFLKDGITLYSSLSVCECLFLGVGHPGARLECVSSGGGFLAELLFAEAGAGCVALGQSLCRSGHQAFPVLLGL